MHYRKLWEENYGIIPKGFVIHHLDGDHDNDDLANLLMLPADIHRRYHWYKYSVDKIEQPDFEIKSIVDRGNGVPSYWIIHVKETLFKYLETITECNMWADYKAYLENEIPNVHHIEFSEEDYVNE